MHFLDESLRCIWLHESEIKKVSCEQSQLIIIFGKGFWNEFHKELKNCKLILRSKGINIDNIDCFFKAKKIKHNRSIRFNAFEKMLQKHVFLIDVDYYSEFERSLLLFGQIKGIDIQVKITDIDSILFISDC